MNNTIDSAYCRLCAELKPHKRLVNLHNDEETSQQVVNKLSKFNIMMDFQENVLPKTVCLPCIKCLDRAFTFVTAVEQAQALLSDFILVHVKLTKSEACEENILYELPDDNIIRVSDLKDEKSREFMEINDNDTNLSEKCDSEVMCDVSNDDCVTNESISTSHVDDIYFGNTEELVTENTDDIKPSLDTIGENSVTNDECDKPKLDLSPEIVSDLHQVEDNRSSMEAVPEKIHYTHSELLHNTVCSKQNINKQSNSNDNTTNMVKNTQKAKHKQEKNKQLTTTLSSENIINKTQKTSNKYQLVTDIDVAQIKQTWQDYEWKCSYCGTIFPNIEELWSHSKQYHNACNLYQCTDCSSRRSKLNDFMTHVKTHRNYLAQSCYKCFKIFPKRYEATTHQRKVHDCFDYFCPGCHTPFDSKTELKIHMIKYYNKITTIIPSHLTCSICNEKTENVRDFKRHLQTHNGIKDWFCETCGKKYTTKGNLKAHIETAHRSQSENKISFHCDICDSSFCSKIRLRKHKTIHTVSKPFICDYCGKRFRTKTYISIHMTLHVASQSYSCAVCNKKFNWIGGIKQHMLQHTGEKPYSCHVCLRDFTNMSNRNKHIRRKHGIEMAKKRNLTGKKQPASDPNSPEA